ncbi:MAG TPA: hypothetical protein VF145_09390, partial [Chitinophagaceae bacterium]
NTRKADRAVKEKKSDIAAGYNQFKEFEGRQYTGMKIGRSHRWKYDSGEWKETKITPDLWEISYAVTKRRKGKAPEGSGVPVGTEYHWYILAHQMVEKLDANSYTTSLTGLKYKLAHKRASNGKWSVTPATQRKHLVRFLKELINHLEQEPESIQPETEYVADKSRSKPGRIKTTEATKKAVSTPRKRAKASRAKKKAAAAEV